MRALQVYRPIAGAPAANRLFWSPASSGRPAVKGALGPLPGALRADSAGFELQGSGVCFRWGEQPEPSGSAAAAPPRRSAPRIHDPAQEEDRPLPAQAGRRLARSRVLQGHAAPGDADDRGVPHRGRLRRPDRRRLAPPRRGRPRGPAAGLRGRDDGRHDRHPRVHGHGRLPRHAQGEGALPRPARRDRRLVRERAPRPAVGDGHVRGRGPRPGRDRVPRGRPGHRRRRAPRQHRGPLDHARRPGDPHRAPGRGGLGQGPAPRLGPDRHRALQAAPAAQEQRAGRAAHADPAEPRLRRALLRDHLLRVLRLPRALHLLLLADRHRPPLEAGAGRSDARRHRGPLRALGRLRRDPLPRRQLRRHGEARARLRRGLHRPRPAPQGQLERVHGDALHPELQVRHPRPAGRVGHVHRRDRSRGRHRRDDEEDREADQRRRQHRGLGRDGPPRHPGVGDLHHRLPGRE